MKRTLFGVAIPDGAVRLIVRPVLGRGPAMPLYETTLAEGQPLPSETDVQIEASRNVAFWEYVDAQLKAKRITTPEDGWQWKLRLQSVNNLGVEDAQTTPDAHDFYRVVGASAGAAGPDVLFERALALLENLTRATERSNKRMTKAHAKALGIVTAEASKAFGQLSSAASAAVGQVGTAAGTALAEASKQTAQVSELAKLLFQEASDLKQGIFELQTARAKGAAEAPKNAATELKDFIETARTVIGLADGLVGNVSPSPKPEPVPTPSPGKAGDT